MKTKPRDPEKRKLRSDVLNSVSSLAHGREMVLTAFKSGIFHKPEESQKGEGVNEQLKILTPNQMLKRLPIALAQVKAGKKFRKFIK